MSDGYGPGDGMWLLEEWLEDRLPLPSEVVEAIMAHVRRAKRAHFLAVYLQRQANAALLEMQGRLYGFQRRIRDGGGEVVLPGPRYYGPGY